MLADIESPHCGQIVIPRSFAGLMELYEQNYLRLRRIAPDLDSADEMISLAPGHLDLYLSVVERCSYTTFLRMTYRFDEDGRTLYEPDLHLRIYHDARTAEAQDRLDRHHHRIRNGESLAQKWRLNRFLYKWLGFCIHQGHRFEPVSPTCRRVRSL